MRKNTLLKKQRVVQLNIMSCNFMSSIQTFNFKETSLVEIKKYRFGKNWPVVYILEDKNNKKEAYIGETTSVFHRTQQHVKNKQRSFLKNIHIITDEDYNKSVVLDLEAVLIKYISADGLFVLQNGNGGLQEHNYYDREKYKARLEKIVWPALKEKGLVKNNISEIKNSDLFKYSPYKTLTLDQLNIAEKIVNSIKKNNYTTSIVHGGPGTGKTILAVYLMKYIKSHQDLKDLNIALVVPMTPLRGTIKKVFKNVKNLKPNMVIGPNDVIKKDYDILLVDEAHRLQRRQNIANYKAYDDVNKKLGFDKHKNQLDWIIKSSKTQILFYDKNQSIKSADVRLNEINKIKKEEHFLSSQVRVKGGEEYISFISKLLDLKNVNNISFKDYDFQLYDDLSLMMKDIKNKNKKHGLSRVVAGYAWPWHTKKGTKDYDIEIDGIKLVWNSTIKNWVNSKNSINEIGCIHTIQGYDLNYVGVIIGPEISYDPKKNKLIISKEKYFDINGRKGILNEDELKQYIINIYKTLLTRGIRGCYVYIVDKNLRNYFKNKIPF